MPTNNGIILSATSGSIPGISLPPNLNQSLSNSPNINQSTPAGFVPAAGTSQLNDNPFSLSVTPVVDDYGFASNSTLSPVNIRSWLGHTNHFAMVLTDKTSSTPDITTVVLNVNPDDFSYDTPYRVNATQTMDGVFIDVWGKTITRLTLRGHTGWRIKKFANQSEDGMQNYFDLKNNIFDEYFRLRDENSKTLSQTKIQSSVTVHIIDKLHSLVYCVVPENIKLLRNKSNPLLHMYEASFIVYEEDLSFDASATNANSQKPPVTIKQNTSNTPSGFWANLGDVLSAASSLASDVLVAKEVINQISTKGGGVGALLSVINPSSTPGLTAMAQTTFNALGGVMGIAQNGTQFNIMSVEAQLAWKDTTKILNDSATLANQNTPVGITVLKNVTSSGPVPPYVGAVYSVAEDTPNTFLAITNAANTNGIQTAINQISVANTVAAKKINTTDMILKLIGR